MADTDLAEIPPSSPMEDNESKSSCMVCYNTFHSKNRVPKILPCGHSFCQECIQSLISNAPQFMRSLPCPTCRKNCTYENPANPIGSIPTNFVLREVLEKQEEKDNTQGNKYGCRHCRREFHEKDLMKCDTCCPKVRSDDSVDFMGRANLLLACSSCMDRHHQGHLFQSITAIASRWKYRSLFEKFEKSVDNEEKRIDKFINSMSTAIEAAKKFKINLRETADQVQKNHGHNKISSVLRNFMRASNESAKFVNMSTECIERFVKPEAPQNLMLGKELFKFARESQSQKSIDYGRSLSALFKETDRSTPSPTENNVIPTERDGRVAPHAAAVPMDPVVQYRPAFPVAGVHNILANFFNPNIPPGINWDFAPPNFWGGLLQPHNNDQMFRVQEDHMARVQLFQGQAFQGAARRRETSVQDYFDFPINMLNLVRPEQETLKEVIHRFVQALPVDGFWPEVYQFFFVAPYDNKNFTRRARAHICAVLRTIVDRDLLIRGVMPHSGFERLLAALVALNEEEDRINGDRNPIVVEAVPGNQVVHDVVVIEDDDDDDDVLIIEENRAGVPVVQDIQDANNEHDLERNNEEVRERNAEELQENDQQDEDLLPRHRPTGHVFEVADFVPPTPAQSTRSALKRSASAMNSSEHQSEVEAGTATIGGNRRSGHRARRSKRGRRE